MTSNNIEHPSHYNQSEIEVIDIIEAFKLDFNIGNAVKYLIRAGIKNKATHIEDLRKAVWYIEHYITQNYDISNLYDTYIAFKDDNDTIFSYALMHVLSKLELSENIKNALKILLDVFPAHYDFNKAVDYVEKEIQLLESQQ